MIICPPAKLSQASSRQNMLQTLDSSAAELWKISDMPLIPFPISECASKLVSHSHTLCVFSHYPGFFFYKQTILSNSSFVSHYISTDHPFIPGCFPAQRQSTSLAIPVFIFSFLFSSKPQAEVIVLTKGQLNQSKAMLHYIGYIVFSQNIQDCFTFHEVSPQFMEMVLFSVVSESQREG